MGERDSALRRDDFHAWSEAEFAEQVFAIFPSQPEGTHVRHTEVGHDFREDAGIRVGQFAVHERALGPIDQLCQRDLVMEIRGDLIGDSLLRDRHLEGADLIR